MMRFVLEREFRGGTVPSGVERGHRSYWRRMSDEGVLLYAGSWTDAQGDTLLLDVPDAEALRTVLAGDPYVRGGVVAGTRTRRLGDLLPARTPHHRRPHPVHVERARPGDAGRLTPHELRVARMMLDGLTNRQMADRLGVSQRAVEQHITRIYRKLSISRRAQLAVALHGEPGPSPRASAAAG
ncbi:LuxR C-terminal-related transcriptional regulator [Micromonospora sp. LOL_014]|uniref:helix-turn-helix transcriptional regulator n=2 Tax=unclassified Micromonospora TaxID=2617518 RepID=UPI003A84BB1A